MMRYLQTCVTTLILLLFLASCTKTKFVREWSDEDRPDKIYDDIMILAVADKKGNRIDVENYFVEQLDAAKVNAIPSYNILPKTEDITRESIEEAIQGLKLDSVIVVYATAVTDEEYVIPTRKVGVYTGYGYGYGHYNSFYSYYPHTFRYVYIPGYDNTHVVVTIESSFWDLDTGKMVWSAQSNTFAPASVDDVIKSVTQLTVKELKKRKLIY